MIEQADGNLSAYVPDLPGCVAVGDTLAEVRANIADAVAAHIDSLRIHGGAVPPPSTTASLIDVAS